LSDHLASRLEVGQILQSGQVPVTILRAAVIIGSGSASFEIIHNLAKRLPVFICTKWLHTLCQPIAIRDVLAYLIGILEEPRTHGKCFDIGGPEVLSYCDMIRMVAHELGKSLRAYHLPISIPPLEAYLLSITTPVSYPIIRALLEGLRNETVVKNNEIAELIPIYRTSCRKAIRLAFSRISQQSVETRWSGTPGHFRQKPYLGHISDPLPRQRVYRDKQEREFAVDIWTLYRAVAQVGGDVGWYYASWLWRLRALLDRLVGGPGFRYGRRHPQDLIPGDTVNFWRVENVVRPIYILLRAEMKLPGVAWLEFRLNSTPDPLRTRLIQTAHFHVDDMMGDLYWYAVSPLHYFVFAGLIEGIGKAAVTMAEHESHLAEIADHSLTDV
ncbi:MAG: SDR family oxidoreductase, partial [Cyanobacteria bacterium NC_groundwater_1444_Ag_S-0.65um_54_12]|nr:SDR family oxidoreductase [Cyanobacteria bacterium NC_groundwater_1444_Ag_S-0.65um_54_12]